MKNDDKPAQNTPKMLPVTGDATFEIRFPVDSQALMTTYLRTINGQTGIQNEWSKRIVAASLYAKPDQWAEMGIEYTDAPEAPLVFNTAAGLLWALHVLPSALTASERAAIILAIAPTIDAKAVAAAANDAISSVNAEVANAQRIATEAGVNITSLLASANTMLESTIRATQQSLAALHNMAGVPVTVLDGLKPMDTPTVARRARNTTYVSPEAAAMYREMMTSCNASKHPHKRFMCKEWRDDYKEFERFFLEHNMTELANKPKHYVPRHEGIIPGRLEDEDSMLHKQLVYGPSTVLFVSKDNQNFYNRNKRDFLEKLATLYSKRCVNEKEYEFMRKRATS